MIVCLGMTIPTLIHSDMSNVSIEVLTGSLQVEFPDLDYEKTLHVNDSMKVSLAYSFKQIRYCFTMY